jgi:(1->4)-alpha-D-glucan 1-alpha-D-glucosylmutase
MTELRATARLQLHEGFTLHDAAAQVPYYAQLGVSHLYLSPIGTAVAGSTHGYDVTDPTRVNPELGGEEALMALHAAVRAHDMGLLLDIVPNHMAAHATNPWWWDVLKHGRRSKHADWFDIDWRSPGHDGKLWLPVLDRPYAQALAEGALKLGVSAAGELQLEHHDACFPVRVDGAAVPGASARAPRAGRARCTGCSNASPIGWRGGRSATTWSITGASSTSPRWRPSAWSGRTCSPPCTRCRCG